LQLAVAFLTLDTSGLEMTEENETGRQVGLVLWSIWHLAKPRSFQQPPTPSSFSGTFQKKTNKGKRCWLWYHLRATYWQYREM
jgi:hypothetical protein